MKWMKIMALALVMTLALSGCSLITVDQDMVNAEAVAEYAGGKVTKGEYDEYMKLVAANYGMESVDALMEFFAMYGMDSSDLKEQVLDLLVEERIVKQKAEEMGLTDVSDADAEQAKADAKTDYDEVIDYYTTLYDDGVIGEDAAREEAITALTDQGYTLETVEEQKLDEIWYDRLYEDLTKDVTVTEERVQEAYDERVASDEEAYAEDLLSFDYAMLNGDAVAWIPEGYRTVKHILIKLTDEQDAKLSELQTALEDIEYELDLLEEPEEEEEVEGDWIGDDQDADDTDGDGADDAAGDSDTPDDTSDDASDDTSDDAPDDTSDDTPDDTADDTAADKADLEAQKAQLEQQIADLKVEYAEALKPQVDDAMARVEAGEDFDALIEELGGDPGMQEEPAKTQGYYVHANSEVWDAAFKTTAMALENIGDVGVSDMSSSGIHIIKYLSDVTPGAVSLDTIRESVEEELIETLKTEKYDATVAEWVEAAEVKKYLDKL